MDEIRYYTVNRSRVSADDLAREAAEHAGEIAVRSRDGRRTWFYATDFPLLRNELERRGLRMADVVLDPVDSNEIDIEVDPGYRPGNQGAEADTAEET